MLLIILFVTLRILSNSLSGVFQKKLSINLSSNLINFICYFILSLFCLIKFNDFIFNDEFIFYTILIGLIGAIGNSFQIKALKNGEMSILAPINSYKIIFSLIFSYFLLKEIPNLKCFIGIILILVGTYFIFDNLSQIKRKDIQFRFLAVFFTSLEAIFIKKLILITNPITALFLWAISSSLFAFIFYSFKKDKDFLIKKNDISNLLLLSITMGIMQFSTNILFKIMNVSYALCLFQLSTILSVFLGYKIFKEKNIIRKVLCSILMIIGAITIILFN